MTKPKKKIKAWMVFFEDKPLGYAHGLAVFPTKKAAYKEYGSMESVCVCDIKKVTIEID